MNTQSGEGNTEIPKVEDIVIEEGDTKETIAEKVATYKQAVDDNNAQLYARTKKAEGFTQDTDGKWVKAQKPAAVEVKPTVTSSSENKDISQTELYALIKADVPQEDIAEVSDYAKLKGISITEALNTPIVKTILKEKADNRTAAQATHTGQQRRTTSPTGEDLLERANRGEMPDVKDIEKLILARKGIK